MKIGNAFRRAHASPLPTLLLSFAAATGLFGGPAEAKEGDAPPPPATPLRQEGIPGDKKILDADAQNNSSHQFWKHPDYDAVVEVWSDPVTGIHGKIATLNPADPKVRHMVGKILKKDDKLVTDTDVMSFKGMEGDLHTHAEGPGKWAGTIYWPFKKMSFGVDVEQKGEKLHVHGFLLPVFGIPMSLLGKSADLVPVKAPSATVVALGPELPKP